MVAPRSSAHARLNCRGSSTAFHNISLSLPLAGKKRSRFLKALPRRVKGPAMPAASWRRGARRTQRTSLSPHNERGEEEREERRRRLVCGARRSAAGAGTADVSLFFSQISISKITNSPRGKEGEGN